MSDPLTEWWQHELSVKRYTGSGYGGTFAAPETVTGFYSDKTEYGGNGEIRAQGRFAFPIGEAYIPVQSEVTLPATFGLLPGGAQRTHKVVYVEVAAGADPLPAHQVIGLL